MLNLFEALVPPNAPCNHPGENDYKASEKELAYIKEFTGYRLPKDFQAYWYLLDRDVDWHCDGDGACLVVCQEGSGILKTRYKHKVLEQYQFCVFNDRELHCFELTSPVTKLFTVNVVGRLNKSLRETENFVLGYEIQEKTIDF